jgi:hypothetical protein
MFNKILAYITVSIIKSRAKHHDCNYFNLIAYNGVLINIIVI